MAYTVLIPYDGSEQADHALDHAVTYFADSDIVLLSVINPAESVYLSEEEGLGAFPENWYETAQEQTQLRLDAAAAHAEEAGVTVQTTIEVGRPSRAITEFADEHDVDHIVMGSHGRSGVSRILLGSVAEAVIRRSPVPVTVVR